MTQEPIVLLYKHSFRTSLKPTKIVRCQKNLDFLNLLLQLYKSFNHCVIEFNLGYYFGRPNDGSSG